MRASTLTRALLAVAVAFALGACAEQAATPATTPAEASPAASTPAVATAVPDLTDERFRAHTPDGKILVTPDNFIRAESNLYMGGQLKDGAFGGFKHTRVPVALHPNGSAACPRGCKRVSNLVGASRRLARLILL